VTFDRIDRQFRPKPSPAPVLLECASCGTTEAVTMLYPRWAPRQPGGAIPEPLCPGCSRRMVPVQRQEAE